MAARTLTPTRALRAPLRVDRRTIVSIVVTIAGVLGILFQASATSTTRPLLVATRDLPVGATLTASDLSVVQVHVDDRVYAAALPGAILGEVIGQQLAEPLHRGQLLVRAQISTRLRLGPDQLALTIPVKAETAAGGALREGDEVLILVTRNKGRPDSTTSVVLERVRIYSLGRDDRSTLISTSASASLDNHDLTSVTLIVTTQQATALANARHNGELDLALLPPLPALHDGTVQTTPPGGQR